MEERSLRIYQEKTFFSKISNTITKILTPTKIGINGMLISIKRNNALKAYEAYKASEDIQNQEKQEAIEKKFEDVYALYLESIDKYIMDSIYKKVKNDVASDFEKNALSEYYSVVHLKETEYLEYKYKKQMYLLNLDYETVDSLNKEQLLQRYQTLYVSQMESLYKGLLKHYSIKLADNLTPGAKDEVYNKIFDTLEKYIENILPLKMKQDPDNKVYKEILEDYQSFERFTVGKLDQNDTIEKNTTPISNRFQNFSLFNSLDIPVVLYMKPVLKGITINDLELYKKYIEKYNIKDVVIGSIFTNYISEETVHFSNKNELFYTKNSDEDMIISELSKITNVYKRSSEVMYKYNVSNHIEKVKNEVAKLLEGDNSGHGL